MKQDTIVREHLLLLLKGGNAYMPFKEAVADFPVSKMNTIFPNGTYTPWHLLEHIRITQWDILDFIRNPDYQYITWPDDYWPKKSEKATKKIWDHTIAQYEEDLEALKKIVKDPDTALYIKIPHGKGQTILKEMFVVADHLAYHTGEFAIMRQVMGTWGEKH
jgi:DinB superfamily